MWIILIFKHFVMRIDTSLSKLPIIVLFQYLTQILVFSSFLSTVSLQSENSSNSVSMFVLIFWKVFPFNDCLDFEHNYGSRSLSSMTSVDLPYIKVGNDNLPLLSTSWWTTMQWRNDFQTCFLYLWPNMATKLCIIILVQSYFKLVWSVI